MKVPVRRLATASVLAGALGLAMPAAASAGDHLSTEVTVAGGATAGGGERSAGGGTDAVLLIGVGIAAVAGSIGLFAAAQVAGRRD